MVIGSRCCLITPDGSADRGGRGTIISRPLVHSIRHQWLPYLGHLNHCSPITLYNLWGLFVTLTHRRPLPPSLRVLPGSSIASGQLWQNGSPPPGALGNYPSQKHSFRGASGKLIITHIVLLIKRHKQ